MVKTAFLILLLSFSVRIVNAQIFKLKGNIRDGNVPLTGISLMINHKQVGNSDSMGGFQVMASLGDTLETQGMLYQDHQVVLIDSLPQSIYLQRKEFQLEEVNISFNKRGFIDSVLSLAFSKLEHGEIVSEMFLRQSVTENNLKTVLLNEGVISFLAPAHGFLFVKNAYKQIKINVIKSCSSIMDSTRNITYASNPQIKLRMGIAPDYYYKKLVPYISHELIKTDAVRSIINISGNDVENDLSINYSYLIDHISGDLKQIKYYSDDLKGGDFFFAEFNYEDGRLVSVLSSAKQIKRQQYYSTNDELFITKLKVQKPEKWNFDENKCGLHKYKNEIGKCDELKAFKVKYTIPQRKFF